MRQEQEGVMSESVEATPLSRPQLRTRSLRGPQSAKLAALHARLSLPARFPLQTLARCLIHPTADSNPERNNSSLEILGQELLAFYTAEWLMCNYPRLPMPIVFAAQYAYSGPSTLSHLRAEWGVENAAAPGEEVDPGYLQFKRTTPGNAMASDLRSRVKDLEGIRAKNTGRANEDWNYRRGMSSRVVRDDEFGDLRSGVMVHDTALPSDEVTSSTSLESEVNGLSSASGADAGVTSEAASASFIRAVFGALYLHAGQAAVQSFHEAHILSRHLPLHTLFNFTYPTRDLARLCKRENLEDPVARLISETGRHTRTPVFLVGVFSGGDKLGEDAGASLNEARVRASAHALRSWYLYSPPREEVCLPSRQAELEKSGKRWKPQMVDMGEIVT